MALRHAFELQEGHSQPVGLAHNLIFVLCPKLVSTVHLTVLDTHMYKNVLCLSVKHSPGVGNFEV